MNDTTRDAIVTIAKLADHERCQLVGTQLETLMRAENEYQPMSEATAAFCVAAFVGWFYRDLPPAFRATFEQLIEANFHIASDPSL